MISLTSNRLNDHDPATKKLIAALIFVYKSWLRPTAREGYVHAIDRSMNIYIMRMWLWLSSIEKKEATYVHERVAKKDPKRTYVKAL
jgi:hypothetical protein